MKATDIVELMSSVMKKYGVEAGGSHLYLWITNNFLLDGIMVMQRLGYRYVTMRTWAKDRIGLGYYWRGQTEPCLFGVRGKLPPKVRTESTLIGKGIVKRGRHSEKPAVFFEEVERVSHGPYLELFARTERPGWTTWGNEIPAIEEMEDGI
jgi:N6-adenosine-specific RNA methylase IME4